MSDHKTKCVIVSILLVFIAFYFICMTTSCTKNEPPLRIGALLPLTGSGKYAGEEVRDGLLMAAEEINEQGGINGHKIEIVVKNALSSDGKISDSSAEQLFEELDSDNPLITVSCLSFISMKFAPLAEAKQRLLVGLVATVPELTQNRDWVYRYWPTAFHEAPPMADIFLKIGKDRNAVSANINADVESKLNVDVANQEDVEPKLNVDIVNQADEKSDYNGVLGIIYMDDAYGSSVFTDLVKRSKQENIETVASAFPSDSKDFFKNVNDVRDSDAVAVIGFDFHIINILKALRTIGYKGEIISTTTATLPSVTSIQESDGVHVTAPAIYNKNYRFADSVKRRYEEKYGKPFTQYSANGYDFIKILIGLLEDKPLNQESVKAIFDKGFVYSGVFGNIELKKGSQDILFPLFPAQIKRGEIIYR
ncbi:MAG: ABC transporter substrate-binding protein [Desulfamplus sp.]|nr:ABC transporter substrate-binding protein [Desulfamplus sp.]